MERLLTGDRLSRAASEIVRLANSHAEGREADAGIDGGEWSGREHDFMEADQQDAIAHRYGFCNRRELYYQLANRTSDAWMHKCFPPLMDPCGDRFRSRYGTNR